MRHSNSFTHEPLWVVTHLQSNQANSGEKLYVSVPKLNKNEVIVPGSLYLLFNIDLDGGHADNFLVQNVSRAL